MRIRRNKTKAEIDRLAEYYEIGGYTQHLSDSKMLEEALKIIYKLELLYSEAINRASSNATKNTA